MRIILSTLLGCLLFAAGYAQQMSNNHKQRRGNDRAVSEERIESGDKNKKAETSVIAGGARLAMEHPTYNFGDVPRKGGELTKEFAFTNSGTVPLVVLRVVTSCSCLKASYSKRPVKPGESGSIRITYEPLKSEPGTFNKVIQVYSNSVDGRAVITVQGNSIEQQAMVKVKGDKVKVKQ